MSLPELTNDQKKAILEKWESDPDNPPSLLELISAAYPDKPEIDGRTKEGRAVKAFLASNQIKARASHQYKAKDKIKLTEEQQEFITNNVSTMKALEMAKYLFDNPNLTTLSQECRTVNEFIKNLDSKIVYQNTEEIPRDEQYKPPKTTHSALQKINRYVHEGIDKNKLNNTDKKNIDSLIGYLHTYRFTHQMSNYSNQTDRELFESSFIRYTHDKGDLTQEEVDQYIVLSAEVVIASNIQRRVERLQQLLDQNAEDTEGRRMAMSLVEAINTAQTEYNQSVNRQHKLLGDLKEKRSDKLKNQIKENASILNLVQLWKDEESRQKLIKIAELRKRAVKDEIDRLSSMEDVKCRIMGLDKSEGLNG